MIRSILGNCTEYLKRMYGVCKSRLDFSKSGVFAHIPDQLISFFLHNSDSNAFRKRDCPTESVHIRTGAVGGLKGYAALLYNEAALYGAIIYLMRGGESLSQPLLSIQLVECIMCGVSSLENGRCMHEKESGLLHVEVTLAVWRVDTLFEPRLWC
jgi:hypothetical protein